MNFSMMKKNMVKLFRERGAVDALTHIIWWFVTIVFVHILKNYLRISNTTKQISAMVRIKNEAQFLYASIESIIDCVEEVVLIDNLSSDGTPLIIQDLCRKYPNKVRAYEYRHEIVRAGEDHEKLAKTNPASERLTANYYNWCLKKLSKPYVLKWDGDMIAMNKFCQSVKEFKTINKQTMRFDGINILPDYRYYIIGHVSNLETRIFRKTFAKYLSESVTQVLSHPFLAASFTVEEKCYVHLKLCKSDPTSNHSAIFAKEWLDAINNYATLPVTQDVMEIFSRYKLGIKQSSSMHIGISNSDQSIYTT